MDMYTRDLQLRLEAVEARQRAYGMHGPDCPVFQTEQAQRRNPDVCFTRGEACGCWLSRDPA